MVPPKSVGAFSLHVKGGNTLNEMTFTGISGRVRELCVSQVIFAPLAQSLAALYGISLGVCCKKL